MNDSPPGERATRHRHRGSRVERRRLGLLAVTLVVAVIATRWLGFGGSTNNDTVLTTGNTTVLVPRVAGLSPMRQRIITIAEGQLGYATNPASTDCNKFSAYWVSGASDCGNANLDEQWCADFAAWVWQRAGAPVTYQFVNGDLNSSSASFYEWGEARGTWHPVGSGYKPQPGDVAVYGLDTATLVAAHVALVVGDVAGDRGPIAINGDGDLTGFSVVEVRADEYFADTHPSGAPLSGYVAPG